MLVIIESPYAGDVAGNVAYARRCLLDSLNRGESPMASHLLYTQVLDDMVPHLRQQGLQAAERWYHVADLVAVYLDRGFSRGMTAGLRLANRLGKPVVYRSLEK
jgi:hypothetical protein